MKQFNQRAVTKLLCTFQKTELREFENFLVFRGKHTLAKMWKVLRKAHPQYEISDQAVYQAARPGQPMKDSAFRVMVTELYGMAKEYVAYLQFRDDPYLHNNTLALALLLRNEEQTYLKVRREATKLYQNQPAKYTELFQLQFQMEDYHYQYMTMYQQRKATDSLQKAADCFDLNLLATKLRYFISMRNRERVTGEVYRYEMEQELLDYLENNPQVEEPLVRMYFLLVKLFNDIENRLLFNEFITYFKANHQQVNAKEARQFLTTAINIAYWNSQAGKLDYLPLRFQLIQIMAEEKLGMINGRYPANRLNNIISAAILVGGIDWATDFLEKNIHLTPKNSRDNVATFLRAYLHFARGEYEKQAPYMHKMAATDYHFVDTQSKVNYRLLVLKTAYEQLGPNPDPEGFPMKNYKSQVNAFRLSSKRLAEVSDNIKASCLNFYKGLNLVFQFHYGKRQREAVTREMIIALQPVVELPWLLGKLALSE